MGFCTIPVQGIYHSLLNLDRTNLFAQLPDPNAKSFTPDILKKAMLETISTLNIFAEEAQITEVSFASSNIWM